MSLEHPTYTADLKDTGAGDDDVSLRRILMPHNVGVGGLHK